MRRSFFLAATLLAVALVLPLAAAAQAVQARYSFAARGVPLEEALERFVDATGLALAYDPALVEGRRAFCAAEEVAAEAALACLLEESGLDFVRLSSGTYVLTVRREAPVRPGYVSGTVVDDETGTPLAYAHVLLRETGLGSTTNEAGQFVLPPLLPGRYAIRVSHLGYRAWEDTLDVRPEMRIHAEAALAPEPIAVTPVVIDGLQHRLPSEGLGAVRAGPGEAAPAGTGAGAARAGELLGALPGVRVHDVTAEVHVQGAGAGEHQMRLDGVPVYLPRHVVDFIGPFNGFAIERLTVHKAGFGAARGSHTAGVVEAEHRVEGGPAVDVRLDPVSLDLRARRPLGDGRGPSSALMGAARIGMWDVYAPPRLRRSLQAWSAPDPFLLAGAAGDGLTPEAQAVLSSPDALLAAPRPEVGFLDLHAAARIRLGALRTLSVSAYEGRNRLSGSLLPGPAALRGYADAHAVLAVADAYAWTNRLAQARYQAVLDGRSLVEIQLRASRYELAHDYRLVDSLHVRRTAGGDPVLDYLSTLPADDGNAVGSVALEASLDHARGRHALRVGLEAEHVRSRFDLLAAHVPATGENDYVGPSIVLDGGTPLRPVRSRANNTWIAAYGEDEVTLGRAAVEAGVRATYLPDRATVYAEPRLALRLDRTGGRLGAWSSRTAAGVYRQFVNQLDVSYLATGALLPSVRVWLPVDTSVRPPLAYHLAQELLVTPGPRVEIRAEAYYRYQPHGLTVRYLPATTSPEQGVVERQRVMLADVRATTWGGAASVARRGDRWRAEVRYAYGAASRRSTELFEGRDEGLPWTEPHRLEIGADWTPSARWTVSARWQGVWGRTWGFRRAYYDYFGQSAATRLRGDFDLGRPSEHVLPPLYQLDLSAAYTQPLGDARLQLRLELLNVLDRRNVADWRLVNDDGTYRAEPRFYYPFLPSAALRVSF